MPKLGDYTLVDVDPPPPSTLLSTQTMSQTKRKTCGFPTLDAMTIFCIGHATHLLPGPGQSSVRRRRVVTGMVCPKAPTEVVQRFTCLGRSSRRSEGMRPPAYYRRDAFQHFVAFKNLAMEYYYWADALLDQSSPRKF